MPPAKFVFADERRARIGIATDSLVSEGCIISGGRIDRCVLSPGVRINSFAHVEESVLFDGVDVGRHCRIRRAIIDKGVRVPPGTEIGFEPAADRARFMVSETGIVVLAKGTRFDARPAPRDEAADVVATTPPQ
jgi:glucose-1-phosphate adenylyltransferase